MARFTTSDGLSLEFEETGAGLPLLCLSGLTRNARDFDDLRAVLPEGLRMICLTSRGREPSDYAADPMTYTVPFEARDALELLDHLDIDKAVVLGTSRGGLIAMLIAATAKHRLAGVLLNDIGPHIDPDGLSRILTYLGRRPPVENHSQMAALLKTDMGPAFPDLDENDWLRLAHRWFKAAGDGLDLRYDPRLREAMLAGEGSGEVPDLWPFFDALEGLPVAVLRGENSDLLAPETVERMQARRPDLIAVTVPNRGHVPFLNERESLDALNRLIARVRDEQH